ncbi:NAD(P)/FAD-dependent oxidoreductase [Lutispora thermophila]|uniref:Thioredoxin reductase (NADPH) n=1 Tax=Lutispora thermophila DSM 19022 TaxID=1122184 RepID=A0A1M6EXN1_9FIRM|nr:NAD(P)/FAD-dependent oxidoreductase [Lutispora thermophila]SHI90149.1 thioredoxin reductase (NADPH) [Lutispora thermophila DSM 19022]
MFDSVIIGGGPAAMSAALNLKIRNKNFIILAGGDKVTGLSKAPNVENYLGINNVSGQELLSVFDKHLKEMEIEKKKEMAYNILNMGDYFMINAGNNFYDAKTIIIATGKAKNKMIEGEEEYLGKGVGYCATCDGPLYRNKVVTIVSENEEGEEEVKFLSEICSKVYYLPLYETDFSCRGNLTVLEGKPISVIGNGNKVTSLSTSEGNIDTDAVFFIRNVLPVNQLLEGLELEDGSIKVDRTMATSVSGVYACGDCTGKPFQIAKAVGEGNIAALSVVKYLDKNAEVEL